MLKVDGINVYYGAIHAVKDVSIEVHEGEVVTLIGANGAGKSTVLQTISGLLRSSTGSISFMGESIANVAPHKIVEGGLAHVPEGRRIFLKMSVRENLEMGAYTRGGEDVQGDIQRVYTMFPRLKERRKQVAGTLSGGEQQMLAIGRALMMQPKMLLLDEPSLGLAPLIVKNIFQTIKRIADEGVTILMVEQNARQSLLIADYAYVLELGKIKTRGTSEELLKDDSLISAYLGKKRE